MDVLFQEEFTVFRRVKDRVQLLKVFKVDIIEGGPAEIFNTAESLVQPCLTVL